MHRTSYSIRKIRVCSNCGLRLAPPYSYCPRCGQENHDLNIPLRHFLDEALEGIFHFDIKSVRTIQALAFKPGFVTSEFIQGKRARYVAPVKLYVFISFLFFLLLSLLPAKQEAVSPVNPPPTITFFGINSQNLRGLSPVQLDSVMQSDSIALSLTNRYIVRQMARISTAGQEGFDHLLVKGVSYMMFALMPMFALFIFLLNRKKARYYIGTLIFSIHYHTFLFLLFTLTLVVDRMVETSLTLVIPLIICPIYLYLAMKYVYEGSRIIMIGKTLVIGVLQFISIAFLFLITAMISILIF